jgi:hypothetical protein
MLWPAQAKGWVRPGCVSKCTTERQLKLARGREAPAPANPGNQGQPIADCMSKWVSADPATIVGDGQPRWQGISRSREIRHRGTGVGNLPPPVRVSRRLIPQPGRPHTANRRPGDLHAHSRRLRQLLPGNQLTSCRLLLIGATVGILSTQGREWRNSPSRWLAIAVNRMLSRPVCSQRLKRYWSTVAELVGSAATTGARWRLPCWN